jgi:hypothetical protein
MLRIGDRSNRRAIGSNRQMGRLRIVAAVLSVVMTSLVLATPTTASPADPIVGNWNVTYGNADVVTMTLANGVYTETAETPVQVVGASCFLPVGTVIATFSSTGGDSYSGEHGLWNTNNCTFNSFTSDILTLSSNGDTLTGVLGNGEVITYTRPPPPHGYWLDGSDGGIFSFGAAQFYGSTGSLVLQRPVVGIVATKDDGGYWLDASDGGVFSFGDTQFYGSIPGLGLHPAGSGLPHSLNAPIVGMVPSTDDGGYFMVASDGGVFAFGDAHFAGSCPGIGGCSGAGVAVLPDASGNGYWLVTQTGNVYTFGDASYYGAPGNTGSPVTSAVRTPDGGGYWILTANGTVYNYGDAVNYGDAAGALGGLNPATAIFTTSDGAGYWIASANGTVDQYGDAPNDGGMSGTHLNGSIIAATGF